jgi:hypothetical protein
MLSERGSMIIPVERAQVDPLDEELSLGHVRFKRKTEHHMTVLNYGIGKLINKAIAQKPELRDHINGLAAGWAWNIQVGKLFHHLVKDKLHTIVVMIDADLAGFYDKLRAQSAMLGLTELADALVDPPPPHITLYTSDPEGKAGIGLNRVRELDEALAKGPDASGLRAFRLHEGVIR